MLDIATEITDEWTRAFGDVAPIGFDCRNVLSERWLRIHSLPGSQRYPGTVEEVGEILRRHNEAATELLGANEPCVAFVGRLIEDDGPVSILGADLPFVKLPLLVANYDPNERFHFAAARTTWAPGLFDQTVVAIAQMEEAYVLFANIARRCAYAPYDGGADLILADKESRDAARVRWSSWLSFHPESL